MWDHALQRVTGKQEVQEAVQELATVRHQLHLGDLPQLCKSCPEYQATLQASQVLATMSHLQHKITLVAVVERELLLQMQQEVQQQVTEYTRFPGEGQVRPWHRYLVPHTPALQFWKAMGIIMLVEVVLGHDTMLLPLL